MTKLMIISSPKLYKALLEDIRTISVNNRGCVSWTEKHSGLCHSAADTTEQTEASNHSVVQ